MDLNNKKVLIVDDEIAVAGLVGEICYEFKLEALLETRPKEAIKTFKREKPFLVFSDLSMPGMTGVELLAEIKSICEVNK